MDLLDHFMPTETVLLSKVDEYYLYCQALGYDPMPKRAYHSPVRPLTNKDEAPSWALHQLSDPKRCEFVWRDYATGQRGDIFDLLVILNELNGITKTRSEVIAELNAMLLDGTLEFPAAGTVIRPTGFLEHGEILVKSRPMSDLERLYWMEIGVDRKGLAKYNITAISHWWWNKKVRYASNYSFAYRIHRRYQLYFPFASREKKFKNNWTEEDIPGWVQLAGQGDVCIITKSYKDVAALDSWGFNVIGQRGEFIPIGMDKIEELKSRFNRVVTLFDNDGKFYKDYPLQYLHVPKHSGKKDPTDYARAFGVPAAIEMVNDLLHQ